MTTYKLFPHNKGTWQFGFVNGEYLDKDRHLEDDEREPRDIELNMWINYDKEDAEKIFGKDIVSDKTAYLTCQMDTPPCFAVCDTGGKVMGIWRQWGFDEPCRGELWEVEGSITYTYKEKRFWPAYASEITCGDPDFDYHFKGYLEVEDLKKYVKENYGEDKFVLQLMPPVINDH